MHCTHHNLSFTQQIAMCCKSSRFVTERLLVSSMPCMKSKILNKLVQLGFIEHIKKNTIWLKLLDILNSLT